MHKVLKSFRYSPDGVRVVNLSEGDECEISASVADGLTAEGYIGPVGMPDPAPDAFDIETADADALRAFLAERGVKTHHKAGEDKLREMAAAELAKE